MRDPRLELTEKLFQKLLDLAIYLYQKTTELVKKYTNRKKTLILILILLPTTSTADPCNDIVQKIVKPPPAIRLIDTPQGYRLLDPKERYELLKQYRQDIKQITELLGKYIALRRQTEEINAYLGWQWERVRAGVEYKKDIWREQIRENQTRAELKAVERQLLLLGADPRDLEACYRISR